MDIEDIKRVWFVGGQIDGDNVEKLIDFAENAEKDILNLKNIIISLRKSNREYNELLDEQDKQIESLQQVVARKLDVNSRLRAERDFFKNALFFVGIDADVLLKEEFEDFQNMEQKEIENEH